MKASLLARAVPALVLTTAIVAAGVGTTGFAQTQSPPPSATTGTSGTAPGNSTAPTASDGAATAPKAASTTHHVTTTHTQRAAARAPGETMAQMADQRIADLHGQLHITAQQQTQWDQFAQVMRDNAKDLDQSYQQRAASMETMNAVENMQSYAQIEQTRAQDLQKLVPAFQTLYTSLSDQQKKQADQLFRNYAARAQPHQVKATH